MTYYKNIAKFSITVDGKQVLPGDIYGTNHYVHSKYMLKVDKPIIMAVKTVNVADVSVKTEDVKPIVETKTEDVKDIKPKRKSGRPSKTVVDVPKEETKNNDIENNSEELDNG